MNMAIDVDVVEINKGNVKIETQPCLEEAYRLGYLSPNYYRDRDLIEKYLEYLSQGMSEKEAKKKLIEGTDYSFQYIYIILNRWGF